VRDISLEIPLRPFTLGRGSQRDNPANPRIEAFRNPLDRAALPRRIAALKQNNNAQLFFANPLLQLYKFDLQQAELLRILAVLSDAHDRGMDG
jgi:hypothetical protein